MESKVRAKSQEDLKFKDQKVRFYGAAMAGP
jgi:hypothetical protein